MIEAIIFDMDGVLVDTEPVHCRCYKKVLHSHVIELTDKEYYDHWTKKGKGIVEFLKENKIIADANQLRKEKRELYREQLRANVPIFNGVRETLQALSVDYPLALATSSYRSETDLILDLTGLRAYFKTIVTCEDVKEVKPDPECFLLASRQLNIPAQKTLVVEDAEKGIIAAKAAGMLSIAISNDHAGNKDILKADVVISHIGQITPQLIRKLESIIF